MSHETPLESLIFSPYNNLVSIDMTVACRAGVILAGERT